MDSRRESHETEPAEVEKSNFHTDKRCMGPLKNEEGIIMCFYFFYAVSWVTLALTLVLVFVFIFVCVCVCVLAGRGRLSGL